MIQTNMFSTTAWSSRPFEDMWYLYNPEDPQSLNGEGEIKVTKIGYWKSMDDLRIFTNTAMGRKTTREFYLGKAPNGNSTGWMMHEYQAEQKTRHGINKEKDNISLCRVFLQIDESNHEEQHDHTIADGVDGDYLEHMLLNYLEQEENNLSSRDAASRSQMVGGDLQGQSVSSGTSVTGPATENSAEDIYATCDFSKGDYLELNDFYSETSSSSSDDSSLMSANSDECFDADAILRDLENERNMKVEEERTDCKYSVSASIKSNQVVIRPPAQGSVCSSDSSNLVVEEGTFTNPVPKNVRASDSSSSADGLSHNRRASSTSGTYTGSHSDQSSSDGSHGSRTPQGQGLKSVGRIAKLGKKYYCCFGSF